MGEGNIKPHPTIGCCGIDCGLCPRFYTDGSSRCPGCGGEGFERVHPPCSVKTCCMDKYGLDACGQCMEFPCAKYTDREKIERDSFVTHKRIFRNHEAIQARGLDRFMAEQGKRVAILRNMLANYDDGRNKGFFCLAAALLSVEHLRIAMTEADTKSIKAALRKYAEIEGVELALKKAGGIAMHITSQQAEEQAVLNLAYAVCAAARTAPKACGIDHMETAILTGEDKARLTAEMRRQGETIPAPFFIRDAGNVDASGAVILVGMKYEPRGLNERCTLCGFENCAACEAAGATCVFTPLDLGIALGSAVAMAADCRVDNRIMFTIGKAAAALGLLEDYKLIMGIPLSVSGKSPFFDRRPA